MNDSESDRKEKRSPLVTCPNCETRVLPKLDGTCPSCQSIISQKENGVISKSISPTKNSEASTLKQEPSSITKLKSTTKVVDKRSVSRGSVPTKLKEVTKRKPTRVPELSKPRTRSSKVPWQIKVGAIGLLLIAVVAVAIVFSKGTTHDKAIANSPTTTAISITYPTAEYTGQRIVLDNGNIKIERGYTGTLPNELPRDVPIYYPGYPTDWNISYSDKAPIFTIGIEAGSDQSSVMDWYRSNLSSNGWTIGPLAVDLGSVQCLQGNTEVVEIDIDAKKDNRILQVSVCATSCQTYCTTNISLFYTEND